MSIPEAQKICTLPQMATTPIDPTCLMERFGSEDPRVSCLTSLKRFRIRSSLGVGTRRDIRVEQGVSSQRIRIRLYAFKNQLASGVDYLHMLIVSTEYLIKRYHIRARYLISVQTNCAALALQIFNLWMRTMSVGMNDLPQGLAFFRRWMFEKEMYMGCVTPSQQVPIPHGESLNIEGALEKTRGRLGEEHGIEHVSSLEWYEEPHCMVHRHRSKMTVAFGSGFGAH